VVIEDRSAGRPAARAWLWTERLAWAAGLGALAFWALATASGAIEARQALRRFADLQSDGGRFASVPDQRLWSLARVRAWQDTLARHPPPPLGVLRIPRIGLEVPVLEGTGDWTLNRAVGWIEGTAKPGADGNSGIAGHRDGYFRGLKDIRDGDVLEIETLGSVRSYRVTHTWIVEPDDVSVLDPTPSSAVTLVTCYPFYFVGSAPQRFIVRAVLTEQAAPQKQPGFEEGGRHARD
jgi:sortase A